MGHKFGERCGHSVSGDPEEWDEVGGNPDTGSALSRWKKELLKELDADEDGMTAGIQRLCYRA